MDKTDDIIAIKINFNEKIHEKLTKGCCTVCCVHVRFGGSTAKECLKCKHCLASEDGYTPNITTV